MASNHLGMATRKSMAMGPSVRNLLSHYRLDASAITSTGPHQTLIKSDVLAYVNQNKLEPVKQAGQQAPVSTASTANTNTTKGKVFTPTLDTSGYQPKPGEMSKHVKELLKM